MVADPDLETSRIDLMHPAERQRVLHDWNQTQTRFEAGTLDGLFSAQVRRTADAIAVIDVNGAELSYAELDARSTKLARYLAGVGVGPERVVGVQMQRSAETIVALLAILKAGGVYLPLDPAYPSERLEYMVKDAGAVLVLDSIDGLDGSAEPTKSSDANRLAYVIYTSGTTGRPKGVAVPHSAAVNLAFARGACHDPIGLKRSRACRNFGWL